MIKTGKLELPFSQLPAGTLPTHLARTVAAFEMRPHSPSTTYYKRQPLTAMWGPSSRSSTTDDTLQLKRLLLITQANAEKIRYLEQKIRDEKLAHELERERTRYAYRIEHQKLSSSGIISGSRRLVEPPARYQSLDEFTLGDPEVYRASSKFHVADYCSSIRLLFSPLLLN
jgi:hypothetical protein